MFFSRLTSSRTRTTVFDEEIFVDGTSPREDWSRDRRRRGSPPRIFNNYLPDKSEFPRSTRHDEFFLLSRDFPLNEKTILDPSNSIYRPPREASEKPCSSTTNAVVHFERSRERLLIDSTQSKRECPAERACTVRTSVGVLVFFSTGPRPPRWFRLYDLIYRREIQFRISIGGQL